MAHNAAQRAACVKTMPNIAGAMCLLRCNRTMTTEGFVTRSVSQYDNETTSITNQQSEPAAFTVYIQFVAILSLVIVTVTGNLLLLAIVFRSRQLRSTVSNALIVNLAVADCMIGVFVLPAFAATVLIGAYCDDSVITITLVSWRHPQ